MLHAIAIDDEPLALKIISRFCEGIDGIRLEKTFTSQNEAMKYIRNFPVDLIFLDINMPESDGIEFYKKLPNPVSVIFTTAYSEFAVEGFNVNAADYLLKPFSKERFCEAVQKVVQKQNPTGQNYLLLRVGYELYKIDLDQILFIQALDDYVQFVLSNGKKLISKTAMKEIMNRLPKNEFIRIHRSYIVSVKHISIIQNKSVRIADFTLPVGDTYRENLTKL